MARVAIIADMLGTNGKVFGGGAERQTYQLARLATESGADLSVYQAAKEATDTVIEDVRIRTVPADTKSIWSTATKQAVADGFQCFHYKYLAHVPRTAARLNATATHFAIYWDIPFDPQFTAWYPFGGLARFYLGPWRTLHKRRYLSALARCREVLADNTSLTRLVQSDAPKLRNRIYYVPNFSDLSLNGATAVGEQDCMIGEIEAAKRQGQLIVLIPRNLTFKQGIGFLPKLLETLEPRILSRCQFIVTGQFIRDLPQSGLYEKQLESALGAMTPDTRSRLTFLHGVRHECMTYCYRAADIVLIPSFASEGTPLSAVEAMTFGDVILATNIGGLNDVIESGHTGLLVRPVIAELATALTALVLDAGLRKRLGEAARQKAERQFSLAAWQSLVLPFIERNGWLA